MDKQQVDFKCNTIGLWLIGYMSVLTVLYLVRLFSVNHRPEDDMPYIVVFTFVVLSIYIVIKLPFLFAFL